MQAETQTYRQQNAGFMTYPSEGWQRFIFKAPITLWRLGLAPLLGRYLVLITHTGRKSGLPRRTMVEFHKLDGTRYVPCAFGPRSHWYRNIEADPLVTLQDAYGTHSMQGRRVTDPEELLAVYALIQGRNPIMLDWYLESLGIPNTAESVLEHKDQVHIMAFDATDAPTPPPQPADLTWVWSVIGVLLALLLRPRQRRD